MSTPQHEPSPTRLIRLGALAGMVGPAVLGGAIFGLTLAQYSFLRGLSWHPLYAPTTDWPSGLALGPYGDLMVAAFVCSGGMLVVFAAGLDRALGEGGARRTGTVLLGLAGVAMVLLGFRTDPTYRDTLATAAGRIHDGAFGLLGVSLLVALPVLAHRFARHPDWHGHARYTLVSAAIVLPGVILKGPLFYLFLANTLFWIELTAIRLWSRDAGQLRPDESTSA